MIAAAHLDNFLFLLFVAIWVFFQVLTRAASKGRKSGGDTNKRPTPAPPTPRSARELPEETDEQRIRKFLDALGQPASSKPPPPVARRPTYARPVVLPHAGPYGSPLPPLTTRPPDLPPEVLTPRSVAPRTERRVFQPKSELPAFEVHAAPPLLAPITETEAGAVQPAAPKTISKDVETKMDIRSLLKTPSGLRNAMILREIFGPPRSMQPLDLAGNV